MNKNQKGFAPIIIVLIVVALLAGGILTWQYLWREKVEKTESLTEILEKAKGIPSFKYNMVVTSSEKEPVTSKIWIKGNKMRWELEVIIEGKKVNIIDMIDFDQQKYWSCVPSKYTPEKYVAMEVDLRELEVPESIEGFFGKEYASSTMKYNPVIVGIEPVNEKECLVIEYTTEEEKVKAWVWKKYGLPIKEEKTRPEGITITEMKDIEFIDIHDSMFELPKDVLTMPLSEEEWKSLKTKSPALRDDQRTMDLAVIAASLGAYHGLDDPGHYPLDLNILFSDNQVGHLSSLPKDPKDGIGFQNVASDRGYIYVTDGTTCYILASNLEEASSYHLTKDVDGKQVCGGVTINCDDDTGCAGIDNTRHCYCKREFKHPWLGE